MKLPASKLTKSQFQSFAKTVKDVEKVVVKIRYDDECGNGHNTFSITGTHYEWSKSGWSTSTSHWIEGASGCIHEEIARVFPRFAHLIKWHLTSSDGPMHYLSNTLYHAGDRDHNGLRKGEVKQLRNGKTNQLAWKLTKIEGADLEQYVDADTKPEGRQVWEYLPWCRVGEGKEPNLEFARSCAVWPEADLKDFTKENLEARLPKLMEEFKRDVEALGFIY